ncbi:MAG: hypothetical protein HYZ28_00495 [Myxococcales bacterium]|nr:hypothetical protein [Myxococcales bacterium]
MRPIALCLVALALAAPARAESAEELALTAELVEIPSELPPDDLYDYAYVMKYRVQGGAQGGQTLLVAHYKPRQPREKIEKAMRDRVGGKLKRFRTGDLHRLVLRRDLEKVFDGAVVDEYFAADRKTPRYWCKQVDPA